MPKKIINGKSTVERIAEEWDRIRAENLKLSVVDFCKRVGISVSSLYHNYPEWAEQIRKWRDGEKIRVLSPMTKKREKVSQAEAIQLVDKLRKELISLKSENEKLKGEKEKLSKSVKKLEKQQKHNEVLRSVQMQLGNKLRKYLPNQKVNTILIELQEFEENHLKLIEKVD